jgi:DNA modification methylase
MSTNAETADSRSPQSSCWTSDCGRVTLYLGDCLDIAPTLAHATCNLILADPPYGMGKEKDGVLNDNLRSAKLDAFLMECWQACRPALKANASAYIWGNAESLWRLWYLGGLRDSEPLTMRNEIVWDKGSGQGMESDQHRMFATASERALFFMLGEQGFNNNADNYWEGWEPIRCYLRTEREKMRWGNKEVAEFFGFHARMADHWFSKSQWSIPTEDQYNRLQSEAQAAAFNREYDDLKREYYDLKQAFYATRAYFDNAHQNMTDVWSYGRVTGSDRHGHATPKPVEMMARCVKSSCPIGGTVLDPFMGSGTTGVACIRTGRKFIGIEKDPTHYATALKRIQNELDQGDLFLGSNTKLTDALGSKNKS